jgi:predicted ATP-grasp superfamily ATP-dependent carboligase
MHTFHKMFGKKAYRCDNADELIALCERIGTKFPIDGLVVQEFLPGGAESLYSYAATVIKGEPIAWIMANRIRQNPMDFGNSTTFAVTCDIPEIEASARRILKEVDYEGLAEVEFMFDDKAGTYKFLEINTRAWKWHSISMGLGYGFFSELLHYYNGEPGDFKAGYRKIAWVERLTDYVVSLKAILTGRLTLGGVLRTHFQKKVSAVWSWKDPLPALMYILQSPVLFVKRH